MIFFLLIFLFLVIAGGALYYFIRLQNQKKLGQEVAVGKLVELSDSSIYISQAGSGPNLVLFHGLGASSYIWRDVTLALAKHFTVTCVDLPGFGQSTKNPRAHYGLDDQSRRVLELFEKLGIDQARLLGSSMGGTLALWLARLQPKRFFEVIVLAPATDPRLVPFGLKFLSPLAPIAWMGVNEFTMKFLAGRVVAKKELLSKENLKNYLAPYLENRHSISTFVKATELIKDKRLPHELSQIKSRCLIIYGTQDKIIPLKMMHKLQEILPQSRLLLHQGGGHHLMEDDPEWCVERCLEFFLPMKDESDTF